MVKITFIRHGVKEYENNKGPYGSYQHDPDIKDFSNTVVFDLYNKNKFKQIVCSPYKRTRNTAMKIKELLEKNDIYVDLIIEPLAAEYLGNQKPKGHFADVDPETFSLYEPKLGVENIAMLKKRLKKFKNKLINSKTDLLVVTHGLNIRFLHEMFKNRVLKNVEELKGFSIEIT